jgi:hypothetical protein
MTRADPQTRSRVHSQPPAHRKASTVGEQMRRMATASAIDRVEGARRAAREGTNDRESFESRASDRFLRSIARASVAEPDDSDADDVPTSKADLTGAAKALFDRWSGRRTDESGQRDELRELALERLADRGIKRPTAPEIRAEMFLIDSVERARELERERQEHAEDLDEAVEEALALERRRAARTPANARERAIASNARFERSSRQMIDRHGLGGGSAA